MSYIASIVFNQDLESDDDLSKYILQASLDGRLKSAEGFLSAAGDLCSLTAASGKDLYLTAAKIVFFHNAVPVTGKDEAVVKVNGTVVETVRFSDLASDRRTFSYEFKNIGHKVAATQVLKIEIITIKSSSDVEGFIQAIEVPTGENPTTYTGS